MSYNEQCSSPSGSSSVQAGPPQSVRSVYLEACGQDRVVTHYAKPPTWRGVARGDGRRPDKTQQQRPQREEEEVERKTGVSATKHGGTEEIRWERMMPAMLTQEHTETSVIYRLHRERQRCILCKIYKTNREGNWGRRCSKQASLNFCGVDVAAASSQIRTLFWVRLIQPFVSLFLRTKYIDSIYSDSIPALRQLKTKITLGSKHCLFFFR